MKRAPWIGMAAVAVFLATMAWADRPEWEDKMDEPLDFTGIDTLEVHSWQPEIKLQAETSIGSVASDPRFSGASTVQVRREGATLVVQGTEHSFGLEIRAPARLSRIVLDGGDIETMVRVGTMIVETRGDVVWKGDAAVLHMLDRGPEPGCESDCRTDITVDGGAIGQFFGRTRGGTLALLDVERIGSATLSLDPEADFMLGRLHRLPTNVQVVGYDVAAPRMRPASHAALPDAPPRD